MIQAKRKAYAKLNVKLRVTGTVKNGYHALDMINVEVSLSDTLFFTIQNEKTPNCIIKSSKNFYTKTEKNTLYKAWKWYSEQTKIPISLHIYLTKKIPIGAGLGGGSSDAAQVLLFLQEVFHGIPHDVFLKESAVIGADIPYFLQGGLCRVQGIGEVVTPLPFNEQLNKLFCIVCFPKRRLSTKRVYQKYDELQVKPMPSLESTEPFPPENVLTRVSTLLEPKVLDTLHLLQQTQPLYTGMSGSGSACFAMYNSWEQQQNAKANLQKQRIRVWATKIIQKRK